VGERAIVRQLWSYIPEVLTVLRWPGDRAALLY